MDKSNVEKFKKIENFIEKPKKPSRPNFTHFISFPIRDRKFRDNFEKMKKDILDCNFTHLSKEMFTKTAMLHFTVCMLPLENPA